MMIRQFLPVSLLVILAACGSEPAPPAAGDGANAAGDVLEGSISDDMLPLESVTSSAPPAEKASNEDDNAEDSAE